MTKVLDKFAKSRPLIGPILTICGVKIFHSATSNLTLNRTYKVTHQLMASPKQRKSPRKVKPSIKEAENRKQTEDASPSSPSAAGSTRKPIKSSSTSFRWTPGLKEKLVEFLVDNPELFQDKLSSRQSKCLRILKELPNDKGFHLLKESQQWRSID